MVDKQKRIKVFLVLEKVWSVLRKYFVSDSIHKRIIFNRGEKIWCRKQKEHWNIEKCFLKSKPNTKINETKKIVLNYVISAVTAG